MERRFCPRRVCRGIEAVAVVFFRGKRMRFSDYLKTGGGPVEAASRPAPVEPPVREEAVEPAPPAAVQPPESKQEPWKKAAASDVAAEGRYDAFPKGIYAAAADLGIGVPKSRESTVDRGVKCLALVFTKLEKPGGDVEGVWPMVQSISSELQGTVLDGTSLAAPSYTKQNARDRLLWHSVYTSILAMDLSTGVTSLDSSVQDIGAAALLHDVGFLRMENGLERSAEESDPAQAEHIFLGVEIVRELGVSAEVEAMVGQHHERCDGLGFPARILKDQFLRCSQVLGLANVVELALSKSNAAMAGTETPAEAPPSILDILVEYRKAFDYDLLKAVLSHKGFYSIGTMVELTNRSICQVVQLNPGFPLRPVVKVIVDGSGNHPARPKLVDLKGVNVLSITRVIP